MKIAAYVLMIIAFYLAFTNSKGLLIILPILIVLNIFIFAHKPRKINKVFAAMGNYLILPLLVLLIITILHKAWIEAFFFGSVLIQVSNYSAGAEKILKTKPVKQMTGLEFEYHCAKYLMNTGRFKNVQVTPPSGDFGADIIATDKKGDRWVFQCKHYQSKVPNDAVQEVVAAKAHYKATKAAVMTNSQLQKKARQLAMENDIELFEMID